MSKTDDVVLTSIVEHRTGDGCVQFSAGGEPQAMALVDAVIHNYHRMTGRPEVTEECLAALAVSKSKVSVLRCGENFVGAKMVSVMAGMMFTASGGISAILPKGSRKNGMRLNSEKVLDIEPGYNGVTILRNRVNMVKAAFPALGKLTQERLDSIPNHGNDCSLVLFGTHRMPDEAAPGSIWFIHSYIKEDDIVEGVLVLPDGLGTSEHGSILGKDLLRDVGEVSCAPVISLEEALKLTDKPYDVALSLIGGGLKREKDSKSSDVGGMER